MLADRAHRRARIRSLAGLALLPAGVLACSAPVVEDGADAGGEATQAVVLVERLEGREASHTSISAKFMRFAATADADVAEQAVGSRLELPAPDACVVTSPAEVDAPADLDGTIELLDVGDVTVRAGGSVLELAPRAFPDVGDLVSGVFYTSRDTAAELPGGAPYLLEGSGSSTFERFAIDVEAPSVPRDVLVADRPLTDGGALAEGEALTLRWATDGVVGADTVYVDLASESGVVLRCAFADAGSAVIPGAMVRADVLGAGTQPLNVSVHRVRRVAFGPTGELEEGEVRFDLAVSGALRLASLEGPDGAR